MLLANDGLLPLDPAPLRTVAVIGPNADRTEIMGGGSAALRAALPGHAAGRADRRRLGDGVTVVHEAGCDNRRSTPAAGRDGAAGPDGEPGLAVDWFAGPDLAGDPVAPPPAPPPLDLFGLEPPVPGLGDAGWSFRAHTTFTPSEPGTHVFTLVQAGRGRVIVDGAHGPRRRRRARSRGAPPTSASAASRSRHRSTSRPASRSRSSSSSRPARAVRARCASASGRPAPTACSSGRSPRPPTPTPSCWWSAPPASGSPRATTAPRWTCPAARTS